MVRKCHFYLVAAPLLVGIHARVAADRRRRCRGCSRGSSSAADVGGRHNTALFIEPPPRFETLSRPTGRRRSRPVADLRPSRASDPIGRTRHLRSRDDRGDDDDGNAGVDDDDASRGVDRRGVAKTRFRARAAYSGTPFYGWQLQPDRRTVQGEIEGALDRRFRRRVPILGAGRTDAGVHARGQALHFDLLPGEVPFPPAAPSPPGAVDSTDAPTTAAEEEDRRKECADFCGELQHSMNRMLPLEIRVFNLQLAPPAGDDDDGNAMDDEGEGSRATQWHAIRSATSKWYSYRLALGPTLWDPTDRFARTHFLHRPSFAPPSSAPRPSEPAGAGPYALAGQDIERLGAILRLYEGTHDFKAFGGRHEQTEKRSGRKIGTVRTVYRVELVKEPLKDDYGVGGGDGEVFSPAQLGFIGEEGHYRVDFLLQGALYRMVRNMVGTAIEVWLGRMPEEHLVELLKIHQEEGDAIEEDNEVWKKKGRFERKDNPCKPAPPEGLTLECVYYDDDF